MPAAHLSVLQLVLNMPCDTTALCHWWCAQNFVSHAHQGWSAMRRHSCWAIVMVEYVVVSFCWLASRAMFGSSPDDRVGRLGISNNNPYYYLVLGQKNQPHLVWREPQSLLLAAS